MVVRITAAVVWSMVAGCSGEDDTPTDDADDETTDEETEPTGETGTGGEELTGKEGSIVLVHYAPDFDSDEFFNGFGVFLDDGLGIMSLADCWIGWSTCVSSYPASGSTAFGEDGTFLLYADTYEVDPLLVGTTPNEIPQLAGFNDFDWYWGTVSGWGGNGIVSLDGDFVPYSGTADFQYPTQLVVTVPDPEAAVGVTADDTLSLSWESAADGMVLLEYNNSVTVLDDDGAHDLVVADLDPSSGEPIDQRIVRLSRVVDTTVDAAGNTILVQTRSEQTLAVGILDVDAYTELSLPTDVADACEDAASLPPLLPGLYWGDTSVGENDESPGDYYNDLTAWPAEGKDVVARIDLLAGQTLTVEYSNFEDASMYLLTDTCDADDGLVGADEEIEEESEDLEWEAEADGPVYLVLDSWSPPGESGGFFFWVDIQIADPAP